jgi:hypothetical protein
MSIAAKGKIMDKDVTKLVSFQENDGECLPLIKCVCGKEFKSWDNVIGVYKEYSHENCSNCHRKFYFTNSIKVYEVEDVET